MICSILVLSPYIIELNVLYSWVSARRGKGALALPCKIQRLNSLQLQLFIHTKRNKIVSPIHVSHAQNVAYVIAFVALPHDPLAGFKGAAGGGEREEQK